MKAKVRKDLSVDNVRIPIQSCGWLTVEENKQTFLSYQPEELDGNVWNTIIVVNWDNDKQTKVYLVASIDLEFINEENVNS